MITLEEAFKELREDKEEKINESYWTSVDGTGNLSQIVPYEINIDKYTITGKVMMSGSVRVHGSYYYRPADTSYWPGDPEEYDEEIEGATWEDILNWDDIDIEKVVDAEGKEIDIESNDWIEFYEDNKENIDDILGDFLADNYIEKEISEETLGDIENIEWDEEDPYEPDYDYYDED